MSRYRSPSVWTGTPSYVTCPEVGGMIPAIIRMRVVLPAPLAPSRPQTPGVSFRLMSLTAVLPLNRLEAWSIMSSM